MEVAEMAVKLSLVLLQKHFLGGCSIDMPLEVDIVFHVIPFYWIAIVLII